MKHLEIFLHKKLSFGMLGFVLVIFIELTSLAVMSGVVLSLPKINSFTDIATPSLFSLFMAMFGAVLAIFTLRTDTAENTDMND